MGKAVAGLEPSQQPAEYPDYKNTLQLIPANLACLEDALADGEEFRILHRPADWESPAMDFGIYSSVPESDPVVGFINSELSQKRLRFYCPKTI